MAHELIARIAMSYGFEETEKCVEMVERYVHILKTDNKWGKLVSENVLKQPDLFLEPALGVFSFLSPGGRRKVGDLGSGAGVVGIMVAMLCADWEVSLIEASAKKCAFLAETIGKMGLTNAKVVAGRAEVVDKKDCVDVVISRSLGRISKVAPIVANLLREGGYYIAIKGRDPAREVEESLKDINSAGMSLYRILVPSHYRKLQIEPRSSLVVLKKSNYCEN
ncbi:MAG: 16S rRNA (guanine(527)-N(7))-methyltransferase RsmG [Actinomycetota bacterium]|nr:16S rRNA (guanine(527)-N(7))-methyltransferase RsmG [Actinomycetota bacterium]